MTGAAKLVPILAAVLLVPTARAQPAAPAVPRVVERALARRGAMPVRWPRRPLLDVSTEAVGAPAARARFDATGAGATVCVVDSGVDLAHRDFRDRAGRTRVRWLLDLAAPPRGEVAPDLEERFGGAMWDAASIDAALAVGDVDLPRDTFGHGTAVAAAAVGDDATDGAPGPLAGIAPEASLVVVDAWREELGGFADQDIATGIELCLAVAGRGTDPVSADRMVIVLSLGGHDGLHDGTEPLERLVEDTVAAGVPVVVAAGNDGSAPVHASGWLAADEVATIPIEVPVPEPGERFVALAVETEVPNAVSVAVGAPDGARTAPVTPGFLHVMDHAGGQITIDGQRGERTGSGRALYVVLSGGGDVPAALGGGRYRVELAGPGRFHVWLVGADVGATFLPPRLGGPFVHEDAGVVIPATAPSAIAVGATTPRLRVATDGGQLAVDGSEAGGVAPFSSRGPAMGGAPKPDLVAPGGPMVTALSGDLAPDDATSFVGGAGRVAALRVGADRIAVSGTSFAAPMVAGTLALALSMEPFRGASDRHLLVATARRMLDAAWSPTAGAGELDVEAFLSARDSCVAGASACTAAADPATSVIMPTRPAVRPGARELWLVARITGTDGLPVRTGELAVRGPDGWTLRVPVVSGVATAALPPPEGRVGDVLRYDARVGDVPLPPMRVRLHVDPARDAEGYEVRGAGCAAAGHAHSGGWIGWLAPWFLRVAFRRR